AKKLGMELAIAVPGVTGIVDRLHVVPAMRMGDGAVLDAVRDALLQEPILQACTIRVMRKGVQEPVREAPVEPQGVIDVSVKDGVVLLDNHVPNHVQKRIAGVLAWWVPGSRDVINGMEVVSPQADSDEDVAKAVRWALTKNRLVESDNIRVSARRYVVTLEGSVPTDAQKEMAEFDAWCVFGVDRVVNHLEVR
ncbi:MAG: BON domain-containing protein, partial [Nitrospirota bacterium]|nr:BON domain-containing protein [Nitrospirota bacterium]